ncbi:MAG: hypothetical protein JWP12_2493 [Bacteroidetes bacterium]|nr:hypothetical protein [Bacteroidota bacterium]
MKAENKAVELQLIEFHYFFNDESHNMDAIIRHKCETEILNVLSEVALRFNLDLLIDVIPDAEGGFRSRYRLTSKFKRDAKLVLLGAFASALFAYLFSLPASKEEPDEIKAAKYEITMRDLEESRRKAFQAKVEELIPIKLKEIKAQMKLAEEKKEAGKSKPDEGWLMHYRMSGNNKLSHLNEVNLQDRLNEKKFTLQVLQGFEDLQANPKVNRSKSIFYKNLNNYEKVTKVQAVNLTPNGKPIDTGFTIHRDQFSEFIIESDDLDDVIDEDAQIEIISPVLVKGRYKWKGRYKGRKIDFFVIDNVFREKIYKGEINFSTGLIIDCVLLTRRELDDIGNVHITSYAVPEVKGYHMGNQFVEIERKKKGKTNYADSRQISLFNWKDGEDEH